MSTGSPLALTMGDPASISSEITAKAWRALAATGPAFAVIADPFWISDQDIPINVIRSLDEVADVVRQRPAPSWRCPCRRSPGSASPTRRTRRR